MLDRYLFGGTGRISPEAPVPVVHVRENEDRAGGAANVAINLASLGCATTLLGIVGNDAAWGQMLRPFIGLYGEEKRVTVDLNYTRYDKVVEALGGHGEHCERPEEIRPALERSFASGKPALINVVIRKDLGAPKGSTYV